MRLGPASLLGTAATLLCASTVRTQDVLQEKINHALEEARPALLGHLRATSNRAIRPGELALIVLAAIHDGVDATEEALVGAIERLAKAKPDETYDLALRLLVLEAWPQFPDRVELAKKDTRELLLHRDGRGAFSYGRRPNQWDLSNTQYAALGLRAGAALGADVERSVWARMGKEVGDEQDSYGGFSYAPDDDSTRPGSYASMTAAGIAVLAICRQHLGEQTKELDQRIARGWQWFERNPATIGSPTERWCFYFHYGLERAAILTDIENVGGQSWYSKGAAMLIDLQLSGGGWKSEHEGHGTITLDRGRGESVPTSFAVLFLRRKFQKLTAVVTPREVRLINLGPQAPQKDVDECSRQLAQRGREAMPEVLQALRSEVEPQRRAAAAALLAIAGEVFGYDPARDADGNRDAVRKAELWHLRHR